ncbi:hypothetical protein [Paenibacillus sp. DMB20]|uniref:hypothetical protein n=1 Tax=Paenibacillus sp. DMB20 TaxID=1642570 RepID=UPI0006277B3A|nr:hypothetical protein [Paenibacillus sp. DMB20]KKO52131.1 hypothetical protein XI25_22030 [Paenibacillus sp. DMB20]
MSTRLVPPPPTEEDEQLIRSCVVHGMMLSMLKRDIDILREIPLKMSDLYVRSLLLIQKETSDRLWAARRELRIHGIRMLQQTRTDGGIESSYKCRGYDRALFIPWEELRRESMNRLYRYSGSDLAAY